MKEILCKLGLHKWVYSLREAQERNPKFFISLSGNDNVPEDLWFCDRCKKRKLTNSKSK